MAYVDMGPGPPQYQEPIGEGSPGPPGCSGRNDGNSIISSPGARPLLHRCDCRVFIPLRARLHVCALSLPSTAWTCAASLQSAKPSAGSTVPPTESAWAPGRSLSRVSCLGSLQCLCQSQKLHCLARSRSLSTRNAVSIPAERSPGEGRIFLAVSVSLSPRQSHLWCLSCPPSVGLRGAGAAGL